MQRWWIWFLSLRRGDKLAIAFAIALVGAAGWGVIAFHMVGSSSWPIGPSLPGLDWRCKLPGYSSPACDLDHQGR